MSVASAAKTLLIVLDDSETAVDAVKELASEVIEVVPVAPLPSQEDTVAAILALADEARPVIVVVDYRLDEPLEISYRGGSVAAGIKDSRPDLPVVMITSDAVMRDYLEARPVARHSFDSIVYKDRLLSSESLVQVANETRSIAIGFQSLRDLVSAHDVSASSTVNLVTLALSADDRDLNGAEMWATSEIEEPSVADVANWVLGRFLRTVGPLCGAPEAAATLGLTLPAFETVKQDPALSEHVYSGVFSGIEPRWWRDGVIAIRQGATVSDQAIEYAGLGTQIKQGDIAGCTWCGDLVGRSCAICLLGCDESHSLPLAKQHGRWGVPLVACFMCIARGEVAADDIDPFSTELVDLLVKGVIESPLVSQ